ncbi:MAG: hypothetical protein ABI867_07980 [Kofleriaceae bacterium]
MATTDLAFFAPQARLVDVDTNSVVGSSDANRLDGGGANPADVDLISAKVTLGINDVCQLTVVLNNQRNQRGRPLHPPWKYNDLAAIPFGKRLRLDMRYGADPWTKMIVARVTDLQFGFPNGAAQLTVTGEDLLSLLKTTPKDEHPYRDRTEAQIVRDVLTRSKAKDLGLEFADSTESWPELEPLKSITHASGQSYLKFLQSIAERLDFEVFVDFTDRLRLDSQAKPADASNVRLHFEPARSLNDPETVVDLHWGVNLIELTPKLKVWEQHTGIQYGGTRHGKRARFKGTVSLEEAIAEDLKQDTTYRFERANPDDPENNVVVDNIDLLGAGRVRERFFAKNEGQALENDKPLHTVNIDEPRAKLQAKAQLRKTARELLTAQGSTIGFPSLRPGMYARVRGLYPPFDGLYYVTQTTHTLDTGGYKTQFALRRPGLLDPSKYPATQVVSPI